MNNSILVESLRQAAAAAGYGFRCSDSDRQTPADTGFPAALLAPPTLHSAQGRRHGRLAYDVVLRLSDIAADLPPQQRSAKRQKLEADALEIFTSLSEQPRIIAVENLTVAHQPLAASIHGETAVIAKARIHTFF